MQEKETTRERIDNIPKVHDGNVVVLENAKPREVKRKEGKEVRKMETIVVFSLLLLI